MKKAGLLGGMSWESTALYYRLINEMVNSKLGGLHSAEIILCSVDFGPIEKLQHSGKWQEIAERLSVAASCIESGGADFLLVCTNTMHRVAPEIEEAINIPLIHIADATAEVLLTKGIENVGLLGTSFTMEQDFYKGRLQEKYGLQVMVPDEDDRKVVHRIIYDELCRGQIRKESKQKYLRIIDTLVANGAEAVILGCTEIGMLVNRADTEVSLLDTTVIHAEKAVSYALQGVR